MGFCWPISNNCLLCDEEVQSYWWERTALLWSILIGVITEILGRIRRHVVFGGYCITFPCFGPDNGEKNNLSSATSGIRTPRLQHETRTPKQFNARNPFDIGLSLASLTTRPSWHLDLLKLPQHHAFLSSQWYITNFSVVFHWAETIYFGSSLTNWFKND